jgi:sugar phosphate isomerase/epimerase
MKPQNFELKNQRIREQFLKKKKANPKAFSQRLNLSWSNWGFGMEDLTVTAARLAKNNIKFIELHGNRYGTDLGYRTKETNKILKDNGLAAAGICGMFSADSELASNRGIVRQNVIDYLRRNVALGQELGVDYFLIAPGAVGRPVKIDDMEMARAVETLCLVADIFVQAKIKGAVEPIRSAEVNICHTVQDALDFIKAVDHPGVQHINGDVYHMQVEESHIGEALLAAGERLTNLHLADSNRCALGDGSLDLDTIIMALYTIGYNRPGCYVTPEPLGPGGDPYPAMFGKPVPRVLDALVRKTAAYFRAREEAVLSQA